MIPKVYTRKEAAKLLKLSLTTLNKAIHTGALPTKQYGGRMLILDSGIEEFLQKLPDVVKREDTTTILSGG